MQKVLRNYTGLTDDITPDLDKTSQKCIMNNLIKATACAVMNRVLFDKSYSECEGCILERPGQNSHVCLYWDDSVYDERLKYVCCSLNMAPVLHVLTVTACSLNCFSINQNHILDLSRIVSKVANAEHPSEYLSKLYKESSSYVGMVERFLYKTFHTKDSLTVFL